MPYDATDFVATEVPAPVRDPRSITDPRERVAYLRDFLRTVPSRKFDMRYVGNFEEAGTGECGSSACIGGWGRILFGRPGGGGVGGIEWVGPELFGLDERQTSDLFFPNGAAATTAYGATKEHAANVLDHYLQTGLIDWGVA